MPIQTYWILHNEHSADSCLENIQRQDWHVEETQQTSKQTSKNVDHRVTDTTGITHEHWRQKLQ